MRLRKSKMATEQDHGKLMTTAAAEPVKLKMLKSISTEAFTFVGSPKGTLDAIAYDKQL